jgi:CHAT domain-containing protein/Tfp pilus assembly protein PilF
VASSSLPISASVAQAQDRARQAEARGDVPGLVAALNEETDAHLRAHEFDEAEKFRWRVLRLEEEHTEKDSLPVADALLNLGWFYSNMARYERAQEILDKCLEIRQRRLGAEAAPVAEVLNALGALEENRSNFALAEAFYRQAIAIQENVYGKQNKITATTWNNLATLYWIMGNYAGAEKLFTQALAIREKALGSNSLAVSATLNNLALLDSSLGDYDEAESYFQRALRIRKSRLGPDHPSTITTLSQLGLLYVREGNDARAEPLLVKAVEIRKKTYQADHPDVARSLFQLALLYDRRKLYAKAEPLHLQALEIRRKTLGTAHPEYAASVAFLARHDQEQGKLQAALPLYEEALKIDEEALGKNHPDTLNIAADLAYLKLELGQRKDAARLTQQVADAQQSVLNGVFTFAPERQRMDFEKTVQPCDLPAALGDADLLAQVVLRTKGVVLDSLLEDEAIAKAEKDPQVLALMEKRRLLTARLLRAQEEDASGSNFASSSMASIDREKLEQEEKELEISMIEKVAGSGKARRALSTHVTDVRKALPKDAALVEYVAYHRYRGHLNYEPAYGAVILTRDTPSRWIVLGSAAEIGERVHLYQKYMRKRVREAALREVLSGLYQSLGKPVVSTLSPDIHRLIISPDGDLNFISFATLLDADDRFFGEDFALNYVSSGRDLLQKHGSFLNRKQLIVFADPDYDHAPSPSATGTNNRGRGVNNEEPFPPLPGTAREAIFLQQEAKNKGLEIQVYRGANASKANLARQNSPYVLHLATHGLYLSADEVPNLAAKSKDGAPAFLAEPMRRSLLALAGASITLRQWKQGTFPPSENDGLVTAQEVAALNLDHTWLVVLSACDTGSGEARAGEGILGLRRGFAEAGAQNLLMTLWPVDDIETAHLMEAFYREALRSGDASGALSLVQGATLHAVRKKSGLSEAVRTAGPFILSY